MQVPVIIDFWAEWCAPCKQLTPLLEQLVTRLDGKVLLAKVNADAEPELTARFGVRSLPTLKLVSQGQLVDELSGAQTEAALREWLAPVLAEHDPEAGAEAFLLQVREAIGQGHGAQAEVALRDALSQEPERHAFRAALVDYLLAEGRLDEAQSILAEVGEDVPELAPYRARFALLGELADEPAVGLAELASRIAASAEPDDLYQYGLRAAAAGQFEAGLAALLQLLRDHPGYVGKAAGKEQAEADAQGGGLARAALLRVFECLPKGDPLASDYRRKMFNYLH